jgi:uncharacterized membrane protein
MKLKATSPLAEVEPSTALFAHEMDSRIAGSRFDRGAGFGLSAHMRASRRRHHSLPRWLIITVAAGAIVAFAFVNFLAR